MVAFADPTAVKVYTVNGAASGSSSALPDWLTRKRAVKGKGKRGAVREQVESTIELIQHFEFPEASNRVKTTRDGHHAVATGTYKPQIRVWDLDQLSLKFERHTDAENVDFVVSPEIFRLNLDQGRFMSPLLLQGEGGEAIAGVNTIDINPAHQLFGFGVEGNGTVEFWDPRSRARVGILRLPKDRLLPIGAAVPALPGIDDGAAQSLSVTAISSRADGLSYAIGTSSGHTLLYDIRSARPLAMKDQGYGLPVKNVAWIEGGSRMAGDGLVLSADKKVIKIWDKDAPESNFASITPAADINDVHHVPNSGLLLLANEGIQMTTYLIPQLGPAPRWASFLENLTEEMEDQTTRTAYKDYKFVTRDELTSLGLDHLVGTPALKPYMHGYFVSLALYDTARVIANPYVYAEQRERVVREKMEKLAESRIRAPKNALAGVKVNKALAEKVRKEEEREKKREERKRARKVAHADGEGDAMDVDEEGSEADGKAPQEKPNESTREYALLNPSAATQRQTREAAGKSGRTKTAVEAEEEESDKSSSDGLSESEKSGNESEESQDSDVAGELWTDDIRARLAARNSARSQPRSRPHQRQPKVNLVPLHAQASGVGRSTDRSATFGQRRSGSSLAEKGKGKGRADATDVRQTGDGGMEVSFVSRFSGAYDSDEDMDGSSRVTAKAGKEAKRKGVQTFGAGMERGGEDPEHELSETERRGRTQRRKGMRSGSKNTFRRG
ncbi:hypothetical protein EVJ58_g5480 [Rhodofomes roseus]|uniref:NUC153 domain-containing protein n=1 Tax=Rhodofomes roseus TaxID=34475 RepID=A0A4Y9YDV1_9APHY|nr:hypothetical protein EVJ58_g5480 [Rhodofomes roseus]